MAFSSPQIHHVGDDEGFVLTLHSGYSIETGCEKIPFITHKSHRAIVLGKRPEYFSKEKLAWYDLLPSIASSIPPAPISSPEGEGDEMEGFKFVGAYTKDKGSEVIEKQGVETLGKLTMEGWFEAVGRSKVMVCPPFQPGSSASESRVAFQVLFCCVGGRADQSSWESGNRTCLHPVCHRHLARGSG